jgi:hypothetical protein
MVIVPPPSRSGGILLDEEWQRVVLEAAGERLRYRRLIGYQKAST